MREISSGNMSAGKMDGSLLFSQNTLFTMSFNRKHSLNMPKIHLSIKAAFALTVKNEIMSKTVVTVT